MNTETITIVTLITWFLTFIGLIATFLQVRQSNKQIKLQIDNTSRGKALKMSDFFLELLQEEFVYVKKILYGCNIQKLYKNFKFTDFQYFDIAEMKDKLKLDVNDLEKKYGDEIKYNYAVIWKVYKTFPHNNLSDNHILFGDMFNEYSWKEDMIILHLENKEYHKDLKKQIMSFYNSLKEKLSLFYTSKCNALLNKLEYFSSHFTSYYADEEMIYQSLHQCFLATIKILYGRIVLCNNTFSNDKYFVNIIELYNIWAIRDENLKNKQQENERTNIVRPDYSKPKAKKMKFKRKK